MKTMKIKESQRKQIWMADRLFAAASSVSEVAVNDQTYAAQARDLERQAHAVFRCAGFEDGPTADVSAFCREVCHTYEHDTTGKLEVIPFE